MRYLLALLLVGFWGSAQAVAQAPNTLTPQEQKEGWTLLFDGKTLNGWENHGDTNPWKIENGAIVTDGTPAWLGTAGEFGDFVLRLDFRTAANANSGIFLRSAKQGEPETTGYELQIWDFPPHEYFTGGLVQTAKANPHIKFKANEWNSYEVTFQGDHYVVLLNGQKVNDGRDGKSASGVIGLQSNRHPIEFRNIRVRKLN